MKRFYFITTIIVALSFKGFGQQNALVVNEFPHNVGGKSELKRIFEQELMYPKELLKDKTPRKVTINFTVLKDSTSSGAKITGSSGEPLLDAEAMRIFKLLQWVPATKEGLAISTGWSITFDFDAKKYSKLCKDRGYDKINYLPNETIDTSGIIYKRPDQLPIYYKGVDFLADFIKENLEYPRQAQMANLQGTVVLTFVVEPSGLISNIDILKSVGAGCDQEAIRVLQLIKWYPAKKNDKLVRSQMSFPFRFALNEDFHDNSWSEQK